MSNLTLLLSKMLGSRKGAAAAPTYTLSGTINDSAGSGLDDVTVTLTGDASGSTTTAGGGAYSFTVPDGSYTVTPTKDGSTFSPASANVTISGSNGTATTMAQVWTISGTVVDGAAAGISGVTVALTGDATDSDTTDENGAYSFTGLSDGSYTVTPTYTNLKMTPASRAANVSGASVAVDAIVGNYLLLPYTYSMSSVTPTSGDVTDLDEWVPRSDGLASPTITTTVSDNNSYTPTGVTKGFIWSYAASRQSATLNLPYKLDGSAAAVRFAYLSKAAENNRALTQILNKVVPVNASTGQLIMHYNCNANPDVILSQAEYGAGLITELNNVNAGGDTDTRRYHWFRCEYNFTTNKVYWSVVRQEDASTIYSGNGDLSAGGAALDSIIDDLATYTLWHIEGAPNTVTVVKIWIGTGTDDWPT